MNRCLYCSKKTDNPKFCCNKHKDRYHNKYNPRGYFAHLKDNNYFNRPIWQQEDAHSYEEECMGIHE